MSKTPLISEKAVIKSRAQKYASKGKYKKALKGKEKLPEITLFSELKRDDLHQVVSRLKAKRVARGSPVCKDRDPGDPIYGVSSGKVGVLKYSKKREGISSWPRYTRKISSGRFP
jgi:hypothetical protein